MSIARRLRAHEPAAVTTVRATPAAHAIVAATLMIAHQIAGKATRDALFLSQFDVTVLPKIVMGSAVMSMLAVIAMARLLVQFGPARVIPGAFALSSLLFVGSWALHAAHPAAVAVTLYLQMAMFGAALISGFWSVVNERFDPYSAKVTIVRIGAAATLGGVLGGLLAGKIAGVTDVRAMLLVLAVLHALCALSVRGIGEGRHAPGAATDLGLVPGLRLLLGQRYLQSMGLLMVLVAVLAALLDYAMKAQASLRYTSGEELVEFFGQFYALIGLVTFLVQSLLGPRLLKRFGIGPVLALMPGVTILCGLLGAGIGRLWATAAIRAAQLVVANSLFRSAFELLYTPLPPLTKRPTKAIIDVASDRLGDVIGSGILLALLAVVPGLTPATVIVAGVLVAVCALGVTLRLHRGYVEQLAASLRDGAISLRADEVIDATTRLTLAETSAASERLILLAKIRRMKQLRVCASDASTPVRAVAAAPDPASAALATAVTALTTGDSQAIRRCLAGDFMDLRLVPFLIPLLAHDALAEDVRTELRWMAPRIIGTLCDALLDPALPLVARQRIPGVLEVTHNPRAVEALMGGLADEEFNVRYSCARALARMRDRDSGLGLESGRVFAAVAREISVDRGTWQSRDLHYADDLRAGFDEVPDADAQELNYSMEHVFTLLGLVLDRDALTLALRAVGSQDRTLSGTALEYLENVLPDAVWRGLWPFLGPAASVVPRSNRASSALVEDLRRGAGSPPAS
jgi:ATP:ADP antiporter, AAA family